MQRQINGSHGSHFVLCNTFLESCKPRFLNEAEIRIQKYNHHDVINKLPTVNSKDTSTNQTIRTKKSLLASTRHYSEAPL